VWWWFVVVQVSMLVQMCLYVGAMLKVYLFGSLTGRCYVGWKWDECSGVSGVSLE
jgi:hypothetical protein